MIRYRQHGRLVVIVLERLKGPQSGRFNSYFGDLLRWWPVTGALLVFKGGTLPDEPDDHAFDHHVLLSEVDLDGLKVIVLR